jgi:hypothetical protein
MRQAKRTSSRTTSPQQVEVEIVQVSHSKIALKYHARHAFLERVAPR